MDPPHLINLDGEYAASLYAIIGSSFIFAWDVIHTLKGDYRLLFEYRIGIPTIIYFFSRISTLAFSILATLFTTRPLGNCEMYMTVLGALYACSVSASSLLFFFRIRAVYDRNVVVVTFFGVFWLFLLAGTMIPICGITAVNIEGTDFCVSSAVKPWVTAVAIVPLIHDTCVFIAITLRLISNSWVDTNTNLTDGFRVALFGEYLPVFSRAFLQDGQIYYLVAVASNLMMLVVFSTSLSAVQRIMLGPSNAMLTNIMTCRVYRNTKFGIFRENEISSSRLNAVVLPGFLGRQNGAKEVVPSEMQANANTAEVPPEGASNA